VIVWDRTSSLIAGRDHDVRDDSLVGYETLTYRSLRRMTSQSRGFYGMVGSGREGFLDRTARVVGIHGAWDRGVRRLAATCEEAHVPLMFRLGPISAEASRNLDFGRVEGWLSELQKSYPHLQVARDHNVLRYPPELCSDSTHPNLQGAAKFTTQVADEVRAALGVAAGAKAL